MGNGEKLVKAVFHTGNKPIVHFQKALHTKLPLHPLPQCSILKDHISIGYQAQCVQEEEDGMEADKEKGR